MDKFKFLDLLKEIEKNNFENENGSLEESLEWLQLKARIEELHNLINGM